MHTHSPNGSRKKRPPEMSNRFTPDDDVSALCHAQLERSQQVSDNIKAAFEAVNEAVRKTPINDILKFLPGRVRESSPSRPSTPWICPDSVCSKAAPIAANTSNRFTPEEEAVANRVLECAGFRLPLVSTRSETSPKHALEPIGSPDTPAPAGNTSGAFDLEPPDRGES